MVPILLQNVIRWIIFIGVYLKCYIKLNSSLGDGVVKRLWHFELLTGTRPWLLWPRFFLPSLGCWANWASQTWPWLLTQWWHPIWITARCYMWGCPWGLLRSFMQNACYTSGPQTWTHFLKQQSIRTHLHFPDFLLRRFRNKYYFYLFICLQAITRKRPSNIYLPIFMHARKLQELRSLQGSF